LLQNLQGKLDDLEYETKKTIEMGRRMSLSAASREEKAEIDSELDKLEGELKNLKKDAADHQENLKSCLDHAKRFQDNLEGVSGWLKFKENHLADMPDVILKKESIAKQLKEAQVRCSLVLEDSNVMYEETRASGGNLCLLLCICHILN
jgi:chromosome segregation ATPase